MAKLKSLMAVLILGMSVLLTHGDANAAPADNDPILEEIIVTAQRREQNAQDVAISVTVFNQQQITDANITNASDLANYTPSLAANAQFGHDTASFSIRGFTQDLRTTASVGTYFAEVVAPRGQTLQPTGDGSGPGAFFDLQNVQVLKGPQGTLFGRNTTGGAVLITPHLPTDFREGYLELSSGNFGMRRLQGVLNIPIMENFRVRLGADLQDRRGHLDNITNIGAQQLGNVDYESYRLSALIDFTENLQNYTVLTYVDSQTHGYSSQLFACNDNPDELFDIALFPLINPGCEAQLSQQRATGQDEFYDLVSTVATPISNIHEERFINKITWDISENFAVKGILSYARLRTENGSNIFGTRFRAPYEFDASREFTIGISVANPNFPVTSQNTFVSEVQLQASVFDDRLTVQAGLYYENSRPDGPSGSTVSALASCEVATLEQQPDKFNCFDPTAGNLGGALIYALKTEYLNRAVYAQASYDLNQLLSFTGGVRYTVDETEGYGVKNLYQFAATVPLPVSQAIVSPEVSSEAPTGLLEVQFRPYSGVMTYAKYTRGYRQGAINMAADPGLDTYRPETVDTYEVGAKISLFGAIPGRFNVAVFKNDFRDMQLQAGYLSPTSMGTTTIVNAGRAEIKGYEVDSFFQLHERLTVTLSYARLITELLEQEDQRAKIEASAGAFAGFTYTPIADTGDSLPYAADHAWVMSLNYLLPIPVSAGSIRVGATYTYTGERRSSATSSSPFGLLEEFSLLNLTLAWNEVLGSRFDLSIFGTNVRDEQYTAFVSGTYNTLGFESRMVGIPRMYGIRLSIDFGRHS